MTVTWLDNGPRNVRQLVVNGFAVSAGKGDPLISAGGRTAHAQTGITPDDQILSHIHADSFFMGVTGIHPQAGLTTGDLEEAYMKRACSERAAETFVMASTEKLGVASAYVIAPVTRVSGLIIEQAVAEKMVQPYIELGLTIVRA